MASTITAGAIFGVGLSASGVHFPHIIHQQMQLKQFHMMKVFLTASAASALVFAIGARLGVTLKPRSASNLGWIGKHDGNVIGGLLIGVGMALTGACPGTIFAQVGARVPTSLLTLVGGVLGGIVFVKLAPKIKRPVPPEPTGEQKLTIAEKLRVNQEIALLAFEALLISAVTIASELQSSPSGLLPPVLGGLSIGLAQALSLVLLSQPLGTSGSFEEAGQWFWRLVDQARGRPVPKNPPSLKSIKFVIGIILGALAFSKSNLGSTGSQVPLISGLRAILGGATMSFGSRLAGGCTSGHGISGMSLLSVSSFISVVAMFAGGIGSGLLLQSIES